ncbi:MAG: beta-ribofuranosylaminobenzene 5'-phosphate synthase family protein [Promethearchaeota archaeon]
MTSGRKRVIVKTTARLHLGFIDLHGGLGRRYGSLGIAINQPRCVLEVQQSDSGISVAEEGEHRIRKLAKEFIEYFRYSGGLQITTREVIPEHDGLGSGTQLSLAVGSSIATLMGKPVNARELANIAGRGVISGIGTAVFTKGGFVIDAGHPAANGLTDHKPIAQYIPPSIVHHSVPKGWVFIVAIPNIQRGLSGEKELMAFNHLQAAKPEHARKISRVVLMQLLPALVEDNISLFGKALTTIQTLVGDAFAEAQGGRFADPIVASCIEAMLNSGAHGAGQSSWGPTCYGLVRGASQIKAVQKAAKAAIDTTGGYVFAAQVNNQGAQITKK